MPFPVTLKAADAKRIPLPPSLGSSGHVTTTRWPPGWDAWVPSPPGWGIVGRGAEKHRTKAGYAPGSKLRFVPWDGRGAAPCCCWAPGLDPARLRSETEFGFLLLRLCEMKAKACSNTTTSEARLRPPLPSTGLQRTKPLPPASGGRGQT